MDKREYDYQYYRNNIQKKKEYAKAYRKANIEKVKARDREYAKNNIDAARERCRKWRRVNKLNIAYKAAKERAKNKNIEFTIVKEEIYIPDKCPILGTEFKIGTPYTYSIDRIDIHKGYIPDNIQIISRKANVMKNDASFEELVKFAYWIIENIEPKLK